MVLRLSTLALPVDCSGDFGPRGLSVQYTQDVRGTHRTSVAVRGCPCVSVSTHRTSVAVHQYTYQHAGPWTQHAGPSRGLFGTSVAVRQHTHEVCGCPCVSVSTHRTSVAVHQYTYQNAGPWIQHAGPSHGLFGCTHRTSVAVRQHTQEVRGCPCVYVSTQRTSVAVHQYTYQHAGPWTQHPGPSRGLFGTSVAIHGCPSAHTGCSWLSVCVRVCQSAHTGRLWLSISTHISTLVRGLNTLALPVDCFGDFGLRGLSVQYTQVVRVCPPAHTGHLWLSMAVRQHTQEHTQDVSGCPSVYISARCTHRMFVGVRQQPQDVRVCPSAQTGRPWLSISTHISTLVLGLSTLAFSVDCSGDFGPCGLSVQYTQDVRGCPPAHTGRRTPTDVHGCLCVSVFVRQHTQDVHGCPSVHISARCTHNTSVGVRRPTQDVRVPICGSPSAHTGRPWLFVCVCVCSSAHTGRPWLCISTHNSTLVLGLSALTLPVDCSGDFGPRGLSVQYTQDVCGCRQHTQDVCGCLWLSVSTHRMSMAVRVCLCVSVSTHRMSVALHQYTYQHTGPWTQHAGPSRGLFGTSVGVRQQPQDICVCLSAHTGRPWLSISRHISTLVLGLSTLTLPVDCSGDFGPLGLSVQYTQDVRWCPPAHTGRLWLLRPSAHTGRLWLSISRHISTLVLGLSMLTLPVDCSGDFGPRGLSVKSTQDVRGCSPAHTGRPWLSVCVRVCPFVSVSTHRTSVAVHKYTYQHYTQDVRECLSALTGRPWLSACVRQHTLDIRGCPSVHISARCTHRTSVCVSQHTQDVRVCPSAHTGRPWLSVSTHRTSVAVHQYTYQHAGPWTQHAGPSRGLFG
ncbi:hypothetical protein YC2023_066330 [Brassica napus]